MNNPEGPAPRETLSRLLHQLHPFTSAAQARINLPHWPPAQLTKIAETLKKTGDSVALILRLMEQKELVRVPPARLLDEIYLGVEWIWEERGRAVREGERKRGEEMILKLCAEFDSFKRLALLYSTLKRSQIRHLRTERTRDTEAHQQLGASGRLMVHFRLAVGSICSLIDHPRALPSLILVPEDLLEALEEATERFVQREEEEREDEGDDSGLEEAIAELDKWGETQVGLMMEGGAEGRELSIGRSAYEPVARRETQLARVVG